MSVEKDGVLYPVQDGQDGTGQVSTTETGKELLAASVETLNSGLAERILRDTGNEFRQTYHLHMKRILEIHAQSTTNAVEGARHCLEFVYDRFRYKKGERIVGLKEIGDLVPQAPYFSTDTIVGSRFVRGNVTFKRDYSVQNYQKLFDATLYAEGKNVSGDKVYQAVKTWNKKGYIEKSAVDKVRWVLENEPKIDVSLENVVFVIFGAGAELGPYLPLLNCGNAEIAAIDLPNEKIYNRIIEAAEKSSAKVYIPQRHAKFGCNLETDAPEIIRWLIDLEPNKSLVLGNYVYADGPKFVKLSAAVDVISMTVSKARRTRTCFAWLLSPTDVFLATDEIKAASNKRFKERNFVSKFVDESTEKYLKQNFVGDDKIINNSIVQQGPNYMLAKRIQQFRALLLHHNLMNNRFSQNYVSCNVAPASSTESVVKNLVFKIAFGGAKFFDVKIFEPQEANSLMALLLLHDVFNDDAVIRNYEKEGKSILEFFMEGACHGGMFRSPYKVGSYVEIGALLFVADKIKYPVAGLAGLGTALMIRRRNKSKL